MKSINSEEKAEKKKLKKGKRIRNVDKKRRKWIEKEGKRKKKQDTGKKR